MSRCRCVMNVRVESGCRRSVGCCRWLGCERCAMPPSRCQAAIGIGLASQAHCCRVQSTPGWIA
jgi:hypothetical protein